VRTAHSVVSQKNRRTRSLNTTLWPPIAVSASRRSYRLCTRLASRVTARVARCLTRLRTRPDQHYAGGLLNPLDHHAGQMRKEHVKTMIITRHA
jgi:hypothetical protein